MKIALIGQKGIPMKFGGVEKHVEELAVGLAKRGHAVFAYTRPWYTPAKLLKYKGVNLISLRSIRTKHLDAISHTLFATIHALFCDYDIIHYHGVGPSLLAWIPRIFRPDIRVIATFHCIDRFHKKWNALARFFLLLGEWCAVSFSDETITVSRVLREYCVRKYNAKTVYVPNGVGIVKTKSAVEIRKKFGLKKNGYILFLSRLVKHKGAHYLIAAYNGLKTDKKLVIAGGSAFTDDYVRDLKKLVSGNENIIFTDNVDGGSDLWRELYSNAYLFVHPSESEGLPIVLLEAMGFGVGVLASSIPENREVAQRGVAFTFKNKSVVDLKKKLKYLLAHKDQVRRIGSAGKDFVEKNYSWGNIVDAVETVYRGSPCKFLYEKILRSVI